MSQIVTKFKMWLGIAPLAEFKFTLVDIERKTKGRGKNKEMQVNTKVRIEGHGKEEDQIELLASVLKNQQMKPFFMEAMARQMDSTIENIRDMGKQLGIDLPEPPKPNRKKEDFN